MFAVNINSSPARYFPAKRVLVHLVDRHPRKSHSKSLNRTTNASSNLKDSVRPIHIYLTVGLLRMARISLGRASFAQRIPSRFVHHVFRYIHDGFYRHFWYNIARPPFRFKTCIVYPVYYTR